MADQSLTNRHSSAVRSLPGASRDGLVVALLLSIIVAAVTGSVIPAAAILFAATLVLLAVRLVLRRG